MATPLSKIILGRSEYIIKDSVAREQVAQLETAQRALPSEQSLIPTVSPTGYVLTDDTNFLRHKAYYTLSGGEYVRLIIGTDYDFDDVIEADTVYEEAGVTIGQIRSGMNEAIGVMNAIIPAHRAVAQQAS